MGAGNLRRCYYIGDSTRTHFITVSIHEYMETMGHYLVLAHNSKRTNQWTFGTVEMEEPQYFKLRADVDTKQSEALAIQNKAKREENAQKRRSFFTVVEGGRADNNN